MASRKRKRIDLDEEEDEDEEFDSILAPPSKRRKFQDEEEEDNAGLDDLQNVRPLKQRPEGYLSHRNSSFLIVDE